MIDQGYKQFLDPEEGLQEDVIEDPAKVAILVESAHEIIDVERGLREIEMLKQRGVEGAGTLDRMLTLFPPSCILTWYSYTLPMRKRTRMRQGWKGERETSRSELIYPEILPLKEEIKGRLESSIEDKKELDKVGQEVHDLLRRYSQFASHSPFSIGIPITIHRNLLSHTPRLIELIPESHRL